MKKPVNVKYKPLSPACGAEILGVNLREELPQTTIDEIRALWNKYIVLIFRGQEITEEEQLRFAGRFGDLGERKAPPKELKARTTGVLQNDQRVMLVSNKMLDGKPVGSFGDGDMWYHIDSGYSKNPYTYTFLYGVELPSKGGNTLFGNMYKAYESLGQSLKDLLSKNVLKTLFQKKPDRWICKSSLLTPPTRRRASLVPLPGTPSTSTHCWWSVVDNLWLIEVWVNLLI